MQGKFKVWALLAILFCLSWANARATTFLQLQSTYLGDGWFQYQMSVLPDPFFLEQDITGLSISFTNQIDQIGGTNNWICTGTNPAYGYSSWAFTNGIPAPPYTETFLMRSSETTFKLANITNYEGATVLLSLMFSEYHPAWNGVYSMNVVGYARMPGLIPCQPAEADGSPTNFVYTLKLLPDVEIKELVHGSNGVNGVDFLWNIESTFVLQGSSDFQSWTNIAYLWSYPPETVWTTDQILGDYGQFFRLAMVANGHATSLPPLNGATQPAPMVKTKASAQVATTTTPRVDGFKISHGTIEVNVATQAGQAVQVQALDRRGTVLQTRRLMPQGTSDTVTFGAASLPEMVYFRASAVK